MSASIRPSTAASRSSSSRAASRASGSTSHTSASAGPRHNPSACRKRSAAAAASPRLSAACPAPASRSNRTASTRTGSSAEHIPAPARRQRGIRGQQRPQPRHIRPQRLRRARRRAAPPDLLHQPAGRHHPARLQHQQRQHRPRPRPAQPDLAARPDHLHRAQQPHLKRRSFAGSRPLIRGHPTIVRLPHQPRQHRPTRPDRPNSARTTSLCSRSACAHNEVSVRCRQSPATEQAAMQNGGSACGWPRRLDRAP